MESQASPAELTIDVPIDDDHNNSRMLKIGSQLNQKTQQELVDFLRANLDVFAWTHSDMCEILSDIAIHTLNIDLRHASVKQKRHGMDPERSAILKEEVDKLKSNGFIRDALYPEWVSNRVLVRKPNGKW